MLKNKEKTFLFCHDKLWEWQPGTSEHEVDTWLLKHTDSAACLKKLLTKTGIVTTAGPLFCFV